MADHYTARKNGQWLVISTTPDVCKTPMGSATPPVPYPVMAKLGDAVSIVPKVRANGDPLVVFDKSKVPRTLGDQPGIAKGIRSGNVGGPCYPKAHSSSVRAGRKPIVRHDDDFDMNCA